MEARTEETCFHWRGIKGDALSSSLLLSLSLSDLSDSICSPVVLKDLQVMEVEVVYFNHQESLKCTAEMILL